MPGGGDGLVAKLPSANWRKVVKALQSHGWNVARQSSSQIILTKDGEIASLSVPAHATVAKGTLRKLIRSAGMTIEEFVEAMKK